MRSRAGVTEKPASRNADTEAASKLSVCGPSTTRTSWRGPANTGAVRSPSRSCTTRVSRSTISAPGTRLPPPRPEAECVALCPAQCPHMGSPQNAR